MTLDLRERPRRNRKSAAIRSATRETHLGPEHFIYPLFVHGGDDDIPITSMPGSVVPTVPMMFLGLLIRRYLVAGLTMGAVKE